MYQNFSNPKSKDFWKQYVKKIIVTNIFFSAKMSLFIFMKKPWPQNKIYQVKEGSILWNKAIPNADLFRQVAV